MSLAAIRKGSEEWELRKWGFTLQQRAWAHEPGGCEQIPVSSNQGERSMGAQK